MKRSRLTAELFLLLLLAGILGWKFWPTENPMPAVPTTHPAVAKPFVIPPAVTIAKVEPPGIAPAKKSTDPLDWNWNFNHDQLPNQQDYKNLPHTPDTVVHAQAPMGEFKATDSANRYYLINFSRTVPTTANAASPRAGFGFGLVKDASTDFGSLNLQDGVPTHLQLNTGAPCAITAHRSDDGNLYVQVMYQLGFERLSSGQEIPSFTQSVYVVPPNEPVSLTISGTDDRINFSAQVY